MRSASGQIGTIILAAGASTRMGELGPKQLLPFAGQSLLRHAVQTAIDVAIGPVIVVLGANAERLRSELNGFAVKEVVNSRWPDGMGTSIQAGVSALLEIAKGCPVRAALLMTADQPLLSPKILRSVVEAYDTTGRPVVAAEYAGTVGTPALFASELFDELLSLPSDSGAKRVIMTDPTRVSRVPFPGGEHDVDSPVDYQAALAALDSTGAITRA